MTERFPFSINYAQIAVFDPELDNPFNNWKKRHYTQGFAWREGSVSFAVPDGNSVFVEVLTGADTSQIAGEATRAILVPFDSPRQDVVIATVLDERSVSVGEGRYQLTFELFSGGEQDGQAYERLIRLTFTKNDEPVFEIKRADAEMDINLPLDTIAYPAK